MAGANASPDCAAGGARPVTAYGKFETLARPRLAYLPLAVRFGDADCCFDYAQDGDIAQCQQLLNTEIERGDTYPQGAGLLVGVVSISPNNQRRATRRPEHQLDDAAFRGYFLVSRPPGWARALPALGWTGSVL